MKPNHQTAFGWTGYVRSLSHEAALNLIGIILAMLTFCGVVPVFFVIVIIGTAIAGLQALRDRRRIRRSGRRSW